MGKIKILDEHIANQIAAGEVVERPASVVKELVENSIDAASSHIKVYIEEYGTKLIEIVDNGEGILKEDAPNAFALHATSKITKASDLKAIHTYGFRGEAIASIRSVAKRMQLCSKSIAESQGYCIEASASKISYIDHKSPTQGTQIVVHDLFANVPARKKFLKTENTENNHIKETIKQFALANPQIHFELFIDDKKIFNFPKTSKLKDRIYDVLGKDIADNLYETADATQGRISLKAFWGNTNLGKSRNQEQYSFINSRFVINSTIYSAISQAYQGYLHKSLKPTYILYLDLDPEKVDVNVHPRKLEVRFSDPKLVFSSIYKSASNTLQKQSKEELLQNFSANSAAPEFSRVSQIATLKHSSPQYKESGYSSHKIRQALSFTQRLLEPISTQNLSNQPIDTFNLDANITPFQIFNTYILFQRSEHLVFIDQHAAAEKIAFEKLLESYGDQKTKPLLVPEIVELSSKNLEIIKVNKVNIAKIGITFEEFGNTAIQVTGIPEILRDFDIRGLINKLATQTNEFDSYYKEYESQTKKTLSYEAYYLLATSACHGSIRAGQALSVLEMKNIIKDLFLLDNPTNCPHGRPTYFKMELTELEKNFKRILSS